MLLILPKGEMLVILFSVFAHKSHMSEYGIVIM
jgi:hypothetical protein